MSDLDRAAGAEPASPVRVVTLLLRRRGTLLGIPLLALVTAVALSLLGPREFTVESRFLPETAQAGSGRLQGLAAQFGVDIAGMEGGESVDFYAELLESKDLLRSVALTRYEFTHDGRQRAGTLPELLDIEGETEAEVIRAVLDVLSEKVVARPDREAGIVSVRTSAPWPELAVQINARVLELISDFNLERRQSRAAAERGFLEQRVQQAAEDLRSAEGDLARFLTENRRYDESPQLLFEHSRLERRVGLLQQLYTSLAQAFEQARIDEVRNTPVFTVVDGPDGPVRQTKPRLLVNAVLALMLGLTLAVALVIGERFLAALQRRFPADFAELRAETRHALRSVRARGLSRRDAVGNGKGVEPRVSTRDASAPSSSEAGVP